MNWPKSHFNPTKYTCTETKKKTQQKIKSLIDFYALSSTKCIKTNIQRKLNQNKNFKEKKIKNEKASLQSKITTLRRLKKLTDWELEESKKTLLDIAEDRPIWKLKCAKKDFLSYVSFSCYIILVRFLQNLCWIVIKMFLFGFSNLLG